MANNKTKEKITSIDLVDSSNTGERLRSRGIYYITDYIETDSLLEIQQDILDKHLDPGWRDDIQIIINSSGGDVAETWALIDLLDWIRMDVRTTGLGTCASAAACLVACGTKGKRAMSPNASMMVHGAAAHLAGNKHQLAAQMKDMEDEHNKDVRFWLRHSRYKSKEEIEDNFLGGIDVFLTAEEALDHGIIDNIVGQPVRKRRRRKKSS